MLTFSSHRLLKVQGSGYLTVFTLKLRSFLLTVRMLFDCVVTRFQYYIFFDFLKLFSPNFGSYSDFRCNSDGFQGVLRCFSGGLQRVFWGVFKGISNEISDGFRVSGGLQIIFRRFSVPLNQILFRMYSEHKSPIVFSSHFVTTGAETDVFSPMLIMTITL